MVLLLIVRLESNEESAREILLSKVYQFKSKKKSLAP